MGLINALRKIFGVRGAVALPQDLSIYRKGFWWYSPPARALAGANSFNTEVVGEARRQAVLEEIVGGYSLDGSTVHVIAQLALPDNLPEYPDAVAVLIDAKHVGFIPASECADVKRELLAVSPDDRAITCKAVIRGGWDERAQGGAQGKFGVWLSLARPLRERKPTKKELAEVSGDPGGTAL